MKKYPKISIVIPSFNQGRFIEQTIKSILYQNYPNSELIIIDGGSTDNTLDIVKKYRSKINYFVSEKDRGQSDAINKGMKKANGDILAFLNSDDFYLPNIFNKIVNIFVKEKADLVYGDLFVVNEKNKFLRYEPALDFKPEEFIFGIFSLPQPSSFWTRESYKKTGEFDINDQTIMDGQFFLKLKLAGGNFKRLTEPLACFRIHNQSKTHAGMNDKNNFHIKDLEIFYRLKRKEYFKRDIPNWLVNTKNIYYRLKYLPLRTYKRIMAPNLPQINS